ncbi:16S rRNA (guanine(966)-N(2))-methyltransferase RsmD [Spiroplasma endosymbiont of Eupeodes luniger]|uniref:16S rRNA (guanine(966)-N(2))-methyltransferase RsmD n=1 Tax=Spiroplasma endosymbiont of Eupeodes luniger TaxID=3066300 RepID=UPI0030CD5D8C
MKIIAGKYYKKNLISQQSTTTRPILSRIRENLFNVLNNYFYYENKVALDLFAGSGSIGLEALSRNISYCYFNDYDSQALEYLKKNIVNLKVADHNYMITNLSYLVCLKFLVSNNIKIDLVFINPPYKEISYYYETIKYLLAQNIVNNYGIIMLESNIALDINYEHLELLTMKKYGKIFLYFYRYTMERK